MAAELASADIFVAVAGDAVVALDPESLRARILIRAVLDPVEPQGGARAVVRLSNHVSSSGLVDGVAGAAAVALKVVPVRVVGPEFVHFSAALDVGFRQEGVNESTRANDGFLDGPEAEVGLGEASQKAQGGAES